MMSPEIAPVSRRWLALAALLTVVPLLTLAGDLYKWQDEEGNWHFSDRPPQADIEFEFVELPAEPRAMVSMRKTGNTLNPSYEFFNHYHGPAELELRLKIAENIRSDPPPFPREPCCRAKPKSE